MKELAVAAYLLCRHNSHEDYDALITDFKSRLTDMTRSAQVVMDENATLRKHVADYELQSDDVLEEIYTLHEQVGTTRSQSEALNAEVVRLQKENDSNEIMQRDIKEMEDEERRLLEEEVKLLRNEVEAQNTEIVQLKKENVSRDIDNEDDACLSINSEEEEVVQNIICDMEDEILPIRNQVVTAEMKVPKDKELVELRKQLAMAYDKINILEETKMPHYTTTNAVQEESKFFKLHLREVEDYLKAATKRALKAELALKFYRDGIAKDHYDDNGGKDRPRKSPRLTQVSKSI